MNRPEPLKGTCIYVFDGVRRKEFRSDILQLGKISLKGVWEDLGVEMACKGVGLGEKRWINGWWRDLWETDFEFSKSIPYPKLKETCNPAHFKNGSVIVKMVYLE
ncbi:hypothetical protein U1Q18_023126 [Sarracenia purpurea var. burkii]